MSNAEIVGRMLGHLIGVALFPVLAVWFLRATKPGKEIWQGLVDLVTWPRRQREIRRRRAADAAHQRWVRSVAYWARQRRQHEPGSPCWEAANDMLTYLQSTRPVRPGPCPHTGFTCDTPNCPNRPREVRS